MPRRRVWRVSRLRPGRPAGNSDPFAQPQFTASTMIKSTLRLLGLGAASLLTAALFAADSSPAVTVPGVTSAAKPQKLIKVCTLSTVEANLEFQRNVQLLQAQRQQVVEWNAALEKETDAKKKKELKAKIDELTRSLTENNQKMIKAYGFSLERNYSLVIETAHIYMFVTDEEAAKFEKEQAEAAAKKK